MADAFRSKTNGKRKRNSQKRIHKPKEKILLLVLLSISRSKIKERKMRGKKRSEAANEPIKMWTIKFRKFIRVVVG